MAVLSAALGTARPNRIVGVIGHWGGNIGHDIMAAGVSCLVREAFGPETVTDDIEQHRPFDVYPETHLLRRSRWLQHARGGIAAASLKRVINHPIVARILWRGARVANLDAAVVCGGPILVPGVARGDLESTYHHMLGACISLGVPVLNLSVGSCIPWEQRERRIEDRRDRAFIERMLGYSSIVTARDEVAYDICRSAGSSCEIVADTGFLAGLTFDALVAPYDQRDEILISYQRVGANEAWGQHIDADAWRRTIRTVVDAFSGRFVVRFICHSDEEMELAAEVAPAAPRHRPKTIVEYAGIISRARAALCNRIHAAIALSSIGTPVIAVGVDTRLLTLHQLGVPTHYIREATAEGLLEDLSNAIRTGPQKHVDLRHRRDTALHKYVSLLRSAVK